MKKLKKLFTLSLILTALFGVKVQATDLDFQNDFILGSESTLEYLSPILEANENFSALILSYKTKLSIDDTMNLEFRFLESLDNKWSEWIEVNTEKEAEQENEIKSLLNSNLINVNLSHNFQFKFKMQSGEDTTKPSLKDLKFEFINIDTPESYENSRLVASLSSDAINPNLQIISRNAWGSNEDLLFYGSDYEPEEESDEEMSEEDKAYWEEYWADIDHVTEKDGDRYYKWPLEYMKKVRTIVIHHTASVNNLDDPKTAIRNIQYYHAVKRGWGDIGYNYVIDPKGNIYEGRRGGEKVEGGHAIPVNRTSIGISVMGNFQTQAVPKEVIESIVKLSRVKAEMYNLDANTQVIYKNNAYEVLQGHRDNSPTACPGENLYAAIPSLRYLVMKGNGDTLENSKNKSLAYINSEPLKSIVEMDAFQSKTISLKLLNVGNTTWSQSSTFIELDDLDKVKYEKAVEVKSKAFLEESSVKTGEIGTFKIHLDSLLKAGYHGLKFGVTLNSQNQEDSPLFLPIYINPAELSYKLTKKASSKTLNLKANEETTLAYTIKNTGDVTWNAGDLDLVVETENGKNSVLAKNRSRIVSDLSSKKVAPNDSIDFLIKVKAPASAGTFTETYSPRIKGVQWLEGESVKLSVKVKTEKTNSKSRKGVDVLREVFAIQKAKLKDVNEVRIPIKKISTLSLELINESGSSWQKDDLEIELLAGKTGLGPNKFSEFRLAEKEVKNGKTGHLIFKVYPRNYGAFAYQLRVGGQLEEFKVLAADTKDSIEEVNEESVFVAENLGPSIRVNLSFFDKDTAKVTAAEDFQIKLDDKLIGSSKDVLISQKSSQVELDLDGKSYTGDIVNLIASQDGILEIENYEHRPSWKPELNDNKFRTELEFRVVDDNLVAINQLALEHYLYGLAEISNSAKEEKIKTIVVAARSYAYHYVSEGNKFPNMPWDLDDDPDHSQKYLGYGFESRAPRVVSSIDDTRAKVVTYDNEVIKVPYFTQSDGQTRSAKEVWGWDAPYLSSVEDSFCEATELLGHGVGISGCGATGMAENGLDHEDIIQYFLNGTDFDYVYGN